MVDFDLICTEKEPDSDNFVELPPELCLDLGVQSFIIRSLYLLPSVMYRLNSLVLARQLGKVITEERPKCPFIPPELVSLYLYVYL